MVVGAVAALLLGGCSLSGDDEDAPSPRADAASAAASGGACLDAGNLARGVLAGSRGGAELAVVDAKAVRSSTVEGSYLVAIRFTGDPNEDTGVWTSTSLDLGDESVRSVDVGAVEVSEWPWSVVTRPEIAADDPSVETARACL